MLRLFQNSLADPTYSANAGINNIRPGTPSKHDIRIMNVFVADS
jgi:hypothetical protein